MTHSASFARAQTDQVAIADAQHCAGCNRVLSAEEFRYYGHSCEACERREVNNLSVPAAALRITIGVDPGIFGALVVLADGMPEQFIDMPTVPRKTSGNEVDGFRLAAQLRSVLQRHPGAHVFAAIEAVSTRPGESPTRGKNAGEGLGVVKGVLAALGVHWVNVQPQSWKRHLGLLKTEKDIARQFAMNRFPSHAVHLMRKKDNGRGDAALIALWAWETEQHAEVE